MWSLRLTRRLVQSIMQSQNLSAPVKQCAKRSMSMLSSPVPSVQSAPALSLLSNWYDVHTQQKRWKSKRKAGKGHKEKDKSISSEFGMTDEELNEVLNYDKMKVTMDHALESLQRHYYEQLSIRTAQGVLDNLQVKTEDGVFPLIQLGQITQKNPSLVIVDLSSVPQHIPAVKKAIDESGLDLNPQQEATALIIPIPKVTREKREAYAKNAKVLMNKTKDDLRNIQNDWLKKLKIHKSEISEDVENNIKKIIMQTTKQYNSKAEDMMKAKQMELLE